MKTISCYFTNNFSDLAYCEKRNNREASFDNITNFYCACTNIKKDNETNYGLIVAYIKESLIQITSNKKKIIDCDQPYLSVLFHQTS